jgi:hypothetical protein
LTCRAEREIEKRTEGKINLEREGLRKRMSVGESKRKRKSNSEKEKLLRT